MDRIWPMSHSLPTPTLEDETHGVELSNPGWDHLESAKLQPIVRHIRESDTWPGKSLSQLVAHSRHMSKLGQPQSNPAESFAKPLSHR